MNALVARDSLSDLSRAVTPFTRTRGASPEALATSGAPDDAALWHDACERMLVWRSNPNAFDPDDQPAIEILDTAIDFAVDEREHGGPAPSVIAPSGDGRVAFEWHFRSGAMIIEFTGSGKAKFTRFDSGRVIEKGVLTRNPRSRKLELGG